MRYELREWDDSEHTSYTVVAKSDDYEALQYLVMRPSIPNDTWYRLHIIDTQDII